MKWIEFISILNKILTISWNFHKMRRTMYFSYHSKNSSHGHSKLSHYNYFSDGEMKAQLARQLQRIERMRRVTWTGRWPERDRSLIRVVPWHHPSESSSPLTKNDPREWRAGIGGDPRVISIRSLQSGIISQEAGGPLVFKVLRHQLPFRFIEPDTSPAARAVDRYTRAMNTDPRHRSHRW